MFSSVENKEAQEALQAVRDVESRAAAAPWTWPWTVVASVLLGLMMFCAKQELWWWTLGFFALAIPATIVADRRTRGVRLAMKQEVRPDPAPKWMNLLPLFLMYPVMAFTPNGNVRVSAAFGAAVTLTALFFSYRELRRP